MGASTNDDNNLLAQTHSLRTDEAYTEKADPALLDEARIGGMSFDVILNELEALAQDTPGASAPEHERAERRERRVQRLIVALAATFRQHPDLVPQALAKIRAGAKTRGALLDALSASGIEASQAALVGLLESPDADRDQRGAAAFALSRTPNPSALAIRALMAQLDDDYVGIQALYGLGTFCRLLRQRGDASASTELGELLVRRLSAAQGELATTRALRAISNSGYAPALVAVKPLLDDAREAVRADALEALRLMESPAVDSLIASHLAADVSPKGQLAALDAFKVRRPTSVLAEGLSGAARSADPHVRYRAVEQAVAWLDRRPELRRMLERVAQQEHEEKGRPGVLGAARSQVIWAAPHRRRASQRAC